MAKKKKKGPPAKKGRPLEKEGTHEGILKAVEYFGSSSILASKLNMTPPSISAWLHNRHNVPIRKAFQIEKITSGKVKARDLRPDVFS